MVHEIEICIAYTAANNTYSRFLTEFCKNTSHCLTQ